MKHFIHHFSVRNRGFSLLEVSIVLIAISFLLAGGLAIATQNARDAKQAELVSRMDTIERALKAFVRQYGRLPCPTRPNTAPGVCSNSTTCYGMEYCNATLASVWNTTYRTRTSALTAQGVTLPDGTTAVSSYVIAGTLPFATLGLPEELETDPWGNRYTYVIDLVGASVGATVTIPVLNYYNAQSGIGRITIKDEYAGNTLATNAIAVLISHGPNGNGAFPYGSQSTTQRRAHTGATSGTSAASPGNADRNELQNCHCPYTGTVAASSFDSTFIQRPYSRSTTGNTDNFDDTVRYWRRSDFLSPADVAAEGN